VVSPVKPARYIVRYNVRVKGLIYMRPGLKELRYLRAILLIRLSFLLGPMALTANYRH